ncbi:MAG: sigma-54-dependent Fis family transcriptional regulator [Chitinophagaceae bacterium]|nr:sigma-54-dependent Fis family transcriptional regulator [Chitinophagaceae bacterium]
MSKGNILIIDDEQQLRALIKRIISLEGFIVHEAANLKEAARLLEKEPIDVILCDVKLPDGNGVDFTTWLKSKYPMTEVILLTAFANIPDGVQAIKNGAFDYITKGNDNDRILPLLYQATDRVLMQKRSAVKINEGAVTAFSSIIGGSPIIQQTISLARKIAPTNTTVLLLGETGSGKEVFAKAIHAGSKRNAGPYIAINCSAFTKDLLEGELFGHKAGAYTGASKDKKGLFEMADSGTFFMDEIGEMNIDIQSKLLRMIENGEFIKLGDTKTTKVDVRIIAATNRDLQKEVSEGHFREDLYYRLNTFTISLPPLRERKEDIKELAEYFLKFFSIREGKNGLKLSAEALQALQTYSWRGNIRELRNLMERSVILADEEYIYFQDLSSEIQSQSTSPDKYSLAEVEKMHIKKILTYTENNKTKAAQLLGIGIATLYRKLEEYGINK